MAYQHGAYSSEVATSLVPPTEVDGGLIVAFGTAPVHLATKPVKPNTPVLTYEFSEFVEQFGYSDDFKNYTLCEVANSQFVLFGMSPCVFVNVLDPDKHYKAVEGVEIQGIINTPATLAAPIIPDTLTIKTSDGEVDKVLTAGTDYQIVEVEGEEGAESTFEFKVLDIANFTDGAAVITYAVNGETQTENLSGLTSGFTKNLGAGVDTDSVNVKSGKEIVPGATLTANEDYTAAYDGDGNFIITILDETKIPDDKVKISYHEIDASKVTHSDIVGGYNAVTGQNTGLELVEEVFPRFGLIPGTLIAPGFANNSTVAAVLKAKCTGINDIFKAIAIVDIPTDEIKTYTAASEWKNKNNIVDTSLIACYPKVALGGVQYHLSTQLASLMNKTDSNYSNIPYKSPSNENLQCDSSVLADGEEKFFTLSQANYLNGQGVVTALNFISGWACWGNRTTAYPSNTDVKDSFIPIRRMFNWISNTLITTFWNKIDNPLNKRLIETVINSANIWLNGLTAKGALLGGRVELLDTDNTTLDLMDGKINFRVYLTPPSPARKLEFIMEYDPQYVQSLFA